MAAVQSVVIGVTHTLDEEGTEGYWVWGASRALGPVLRPNRFSQKIRFSQESLTAGHRAPRTFAAERNQLETTT